MAAFGTGGIRSQVRGPSLGFRFTLYAILSIVVMFLDQRHGWLEQARFVLQAAAYPIQLAVNSPSTAWNWLSQSFRSRESLEAENASLRRKQHELELRTMRYDALARENGELRGLRDALPPVADRWLAAEVVTDSHRQRIVINRGTSNGVFKAQVVLDDKGVIGQTTHVGPWSAEVILITNPEHAIPVTIERTGLRTIAVGAGDEDSASLALPYLPGNADIKPGDQLVTSGLGGVFPAGYPVGRVSEVHRDAVQPLAQVRATPYGDVDNDRDVMLVWFREDHPAAPVTVTTGDLPTGNKNLQPQPAPPPRPQTTPQAAQPETPAATPPTTNSTAPHTANSSGGARKPTSPSGTVNPTPAPPSNKGTTPARASAEAPPATKEPAPVEAPKSPTSEQPTSPPPRDP
ncbi:MAG TPA: rod shape-determining protein MreC [Steroidobacteraceae bacterium]